jgi:hypothetical protein
MQREHAPLPAGAGAEPGTMHERRVWDGANLVQQLAELVL